MTQYFPIASATIAKYSLLREVPGMTYLQLLLQYATMGIHNNRGNHHDIIVTSMTSHTIYIATAYLTWNQHELLRNVALPQDIPDFS